MTTDDIVLQRLDEMVCLLAIIAKRGARQADLITELGDQGVTPTRIAQLLGTSPNAVSVTLHKMRKARKSKG
jgi:predicted transcriptional regulator